MDAEWTWCQEGFVGAGDPDDPDEQAVAVLEHYDLGHREAPSVGLADRRLPPRGSGSLARRGRDALAR